MDNHDVTRQRVLHRVLQDKASELGNREFLRFQGKSFGYGDLDRASSRVATGLQTLGLGRGDRAAIIMGNRPEYLSLWFGLSKLGAIEVPLNTAHRGDLLTYMLGQSGSRVVVVEDIFLDRLAPVLRHLPHVERVVVFGDGYSCPR
jgi:crotonobetaine/carnitine-CoA ligase